MATLTRMLSDVSRTARASQWTRRDLLGTALAALVLGAGDGPPMAVAAPTKPKPWFEAKSAFVFPLAPGPLPTSRDELASSLTAGWKAHLRFPEATEIVNLDGGRYPALGTLHVNLNGAVVRSEGDKATPPLRPTGKVLDRVTVRDFDLSAKPLVSEKSRLDIHVAATDARLDFQYDRDHRPLAMLADAAEATLEFDVSIPDVERMLVADFNEMGQRYGVSVKKASLKFTAVNNRTLDLDLHLSTRVAFIPAGMRFQAHVDIADDMYARLTHLKCDGDEALGPLMTSLIRPGLAKYQGKSRPIFSFPNGQLKLRNVKVSGGDEIKVLASFAR